MRSRCPISGEGLAEGRSPAGSSREGDAVDEHQPIVEIQTEKATVEVGAPVAGVVLRIIAREGELAAVGATLAMIGERAASSSCTPSPSPPAEEPARGADHRGRRLGAARGARAPSAGARARRRLLGRQRNRRGRAGDRGGHPGCGRASRGPARPGARDPAGDRRAGRAHAPRDPGRDLRRGVRLHGRRSRHCSSPPRLLPSPPRSSSIPS